MPLKPKPRSVTSPVASRIAELRKSLGMNQTQLAHALGAKPSAVSKWEAAKNKPSPDIFVGLAKLSDGADKIFFLDQAGVPAEFFDGSPLSPGMYKGALRTVAESLTDRRTEENWRADAATRIIPFLKNSKSLGDPNAMSAASVSVPFALPVEWFPPDANVEAVRYPSPQPSFIPGDLTVLIDVSKKDRDRLVGCVVAVRTAAGPELRLLRKYGITYMLLPLREDAGHAAHELRSDGNWSIIGKVLKWIGDAPTPRK